MKKSPLLTKREIARCLKKYPNWSVNKKETEFKASFSFSTHVEALVFIARVTVHAEVLQHHPDITFSYCKVTITLTTHDLKCLSKVDLALLERIEKLQN